jgi:curved DNA-binding protein CbpA
MQNHYDTLNVSKTASLEEITRSYKKLAFEYHPDIVPRHLRRQNPNVTKEEIEQAVSKGIEQFKLVSHAYSILSDSDQRARYDAGDAPVENTPFSTNDDWFDNFFKDFPLGEHVDRQSFDDMLSNIHTKLDKTLLRAQGNVRYQEIAKVISTLKQELNAAIPKDDAITQQSIDNKHNLIPGIKVYQFLLDAQVAINKAKATQEPATHRGFVFRTPLLRELTLLGLVIMRLVFFALMKAAYYYRKIDAPVYRTGLCHGLFAPPKTRTLYHLDSFSDQLNIQEKLLKLGIDGVAEGGHGLSSICFNPKREEDYEIEEYYHFSI